MKLCRYNAHQKKVGFIYYEAIVCTFWNCSRRNSWRRGHECKIRSSLRENYRGLWSQHTGVAATFLTTWLHLQRNYCSYLMRVEEWRTCPPLQAVTALLLWSPSPFPSAAVVTSYESWALQSQLVQSPTCTSSHAALETNVAVFEIYILWSKK